MKELEYYLKERKYRKLLEELDWLKLCIQTDNEEFEKKLKQLKKLRKELGYDENKHEKI